MIFQQTINIIKFEGSLLFLKEILNSSERKESFEMISFPPKIFLFTDQFKNNAMHGSTHKAKFTEEEDKELIKLVGEKGENWSLIFSLMPGRSIRRCHDRWCTYLSPNLNHSPWMSEEDSLLAQQYSVFGPRWVKLSAFFKGRTDTQLKNRWNILQRRLNQKPTDIESIAIVKQEPRREELSIHQDVLDPKLIESIFQQESAQLDFNLSFE